MTRRGGVVAGVVVIVVAALVVPGAVGFYTSRTKLRECAAGLKLGAPLAEVRARVTSDACEGLERATAGNVWTLDASSFVVFGNWRLQLLFRDDALVGIRYLTGPSWDEHPAGAPPDQ